MSNTKGKITCLAILTLLFISTFSAVSAETGKIAGYVYCIEGKKPLKGITVTLILPGAPYNLYAITDSNGYFEFNNIAPGTYTLFATSLTYIEQLETVSVSGITGPAAGTDTSSANFDLEVNYLTNYCDG